MVVVIIANLLSKNHARRFRTLWTIQPILYCIVLLCLFLPESQTWMTSEGLNLQLLSMHFLISNFYNDVETSVAMSH